MRAITVQPGVKDSLRLDDVPEPTEADGAVIVRTLALGACGTDREIVAGHHGQAPPGQERLVLGHESLGVVEEAPEGTLRRGDHVVGIVRRPDPVPCPACAAGEWDMCRNGRYTERGIKARHGFGSERFRIEPEFAVKVDPALGLLAVLLEPASIVAKAWDHVDRIGRRAGHWAPRRALVTGAGPVGLLAALMAVQRGLEVHVIDRDDSGPKPGIVRALGGRFHSDLRDAESALGSGSGSDSGSDSDCASGRGSGGPDVILECTGAPAVVAWVLGRTAPAGITCLLSVTPSRVLEVDVGLMNRRMVLGNGTLFGSVNANRAHYETAATALAMAGEGWLARLVTRRVPLDRWSEAYERRPGDVKVAIDFGP